MNNKKYSIENGNGKSKENTNETILSYKCPICRQSLGKHEFEKAIYELNDNTEKRANEIASHKVAVEIEKIGGEYENKLFKKDQELQKYKDEVNTEVNKQVQLQIIKFQDEQNKKSKKEKEELKQEYELKLRQKDEEIKVAKIQSNTEALEETKQKVIRDKTEFLLKIDRLQKLVEKQQQIIENVPPEFRGTAGEIMLFDELHKAFPQDDLIQKTNGVEMPDIIQTIVTENGNKICTPILWDMKTGETVTSKDIEKAKKYKEKYNTDYCIIVTAKGITTKDSKIYQTVLLGKREEVYFVHPKMVVAVAQLTRNFIIEKAKLVQTNSGKVSKQMKLYDYITSDARFRKMQEKMLKKIKLDDLQRKEQDYLIKLWRETNKLRQEWYELDKEDQDNITSITQEVKDR